MTAIKTNGFILSEGGKNVHHPGNIQPSDLTACLGTRSRPTQPACNGQ